MLQRSSIASLAWTLFLVGVISPLAAGEFVDLPPTGWGTSLYSIAGMKERQLCAVAHPAASQSDLTFQGDKPLPAGQYRLKLTLAPSHTYDLSAWNGGLTVSAGKAEIAKYAGTDFIRPALAETKTIDFMHAEAGPLSLKLAGFVNHQVFDQYRLTNLDKKGVIKPSSVDDVLNGEISAEKAPSDLELTPSANYYYILQKAQISPLSLSGAITKMEIDKIRYLPGETLKGFATVADVGGEGGSGKLVIELERDVDTRIPVQEIPVKLDATPRKIEFSFELPKVELGYSIIVAYVSDDGRDRSQRVAYFNIAKQIYRVAIHGAPSVIICGQPMERLREAYRRAMDDYQNCSESFAWAEEDMVGMSPDGDYWYSGQTCYWMRKQGVKDCIQAAHERGIGMISYAKFVMSGFIGWRTAWDWPGDHKRNWLFPVGMWARLDVHDLDRFRFKEFVPEQHRPAVGGIIKPGRQDFLPIHPDATAKMASVAAQEVIRSVEMFGWDGIRWDDHPRGGGQCGSGGSYDYQAARKTQTLVRYFKDIVNAKYPGFAHGYNYLPVEETPDPNWAVEDFELDELCQNEGLIMNESIRKSEGKDWHFMVANMNTQADLARERGGFMLTIGQDDATVRDSLIERALTFATGCRPYGVSCGYRLANRYATRYSRYTLDERLRRIVKPEEILKTASATRLWWQPFVFETPAENGVSQLVVNCFNIDPNSRIGWIKDPKASIDLWPGTEPVDFVLSLPATHQAVKAHWIEPFTLEVTDAPIHDGRIAAPPVRLWQVLIVDMKPAPGAAALAQTLGPGKTFGLQRPDANIVRFDFKPLDIAQSDAEIAAEMEARFGRCAPHFDEDPNLAQMTGTARNAALLAAKQNPANDPNAILKQKWKGAQLGDDLKARDNKQNFGDMTPVRNGVMDIYYVRGAMDYRLRMHEAFARLERFDLHEGSVSGRMTHYKINDALPWRSFPSQDLIVYTDTPHSAIEAQNAYALVDYVKAGGGVLFTGGQYSFGKGNYQWTVLERDLLPVTMVEQVDTRVSPTPLYIEPGKDLKDLGVGDAFFDKQAPPAFWVWNQVALKDSPEVKVFMKSGNRPILVGWQLGKGRVACFLATQMGKSENGLTAFFDSPHWPSVVEALCRWTAPDAFKCEPPKVVPLNDAELQALRKDLDSLTSGDAMDDALKDLGKSGNDALSEANAPKNEVGGKNLDAASLETRLAIIRKLLRSTGEATSALLAEQLRVNNLPPDIKQDILDFVARQPPNDLAGLGRKFLANVDPEVKGTGIELLAMAGDPEFTTVVKTPPHGDEGFANILNRHIGMALVVYAKDDLKDQAAAVVAAWAKKERDTKNAYTGGEDFSLACPEMPCLDHETLLARIGYLAYLARLDPKAYGADLARQWALVPQYIDHGEQTLAQIWDPEIHRSAKEILKAQQDTRLIRDLQAAFGRMGRMTTPRMREVFQAAQASAAAGFARSAFQLEARRIIPFLGTYSPAESAEALKILASARQSLLADWAKQRIQTR